MSGKDTLHFLQGAITANVARLEEKTSGTPPICLTAVLNPQGRMLADVILYRVDGPEQRVFADADERVIPDLLKFLKRFKLRAKVTLKDVSDQYAVYQAWDAAPEEVQQSALLRNDTRAPGMGWRMLLPESEAPKVGPSEAYTVHRILHGVPEGAVDIREGSSLPLESCIDYMHGVDFRKGCYIGQELTARTYFTGVTRKRIAPVMLGESDGKTLAFDSSAPQLAEPGADIRLVSGERSRSAGRLLGGMHNIALALVRLEHMEKVNAGGASFEVAAAGGNCALHAFRPHWWPQ